jgi:ATP-dependent exoDNAse (exonuclease V) alpha subunit
MNEEELDKLSGEVQIFEATTKGSKVNIEKILKSSLVIEKIGIKKGAMVIFIKNNYDKGYINGTLGKVVSFSKNGKFPVVEIFSGRNIIVDQDEWILEDDNGKIKAVLKQVPLRLAWALTVHKSQGMSLDAAEIDLSKTFENLNLGVLVFSVTFHHDD